MARPGLVYSATADMVCAEMTAQTRWIDMHPGMLRAVTVMVVVGSGEAPIEGLASARRSNGSCSFPASRFHEWAFVIRSEGISETRPTSLNSARSRWVGYFFQPAFRHRLARCDHSRRTIHPSSWWKRVLIWERQ